MYILYMREKMQGLSDIITPQWVPVVSMFLFP